jgi:DNA (cytosine-5)-methyltransferase 1
MSNRVVVDLFAGGGGESSGIVAGAEAAGVGVELHAVNHWERAIETHAANFPWAKHYCTDLDALDPRKVVPGGRVDLLWASPECTHHSQARGGRPCSDQSRASAWMVLKWLQELYVPRVIVENVPEFAEWGPLDSGGRPLMRASGQTFMAWCGAIESLGYKVEHRILQAADYGAPTARRRLFVQAVRGRARMLWPEPTHARSAGEDLFGHRLQGWVPVSRIIDLGLRGQPLARRDRPLAGQTLAQIEEGRGRWPGRPFLVEYYGTGRPRPLTETLRTLTTHDRYALYVPGGPDGPEMRTLAISEMAAAMGFPASYALTGGRTEQVMQLGNAVPPPLAEALAEGVSSIGMRELWRRVGDGPAGKAVGPVTSMDVTEECISP